jgi:hypothetical protein
MVRPQELFPQLERPLQRTEDRAENPLEVRSNPLALSHYSHTRGNKTALIHTSPRSYFKCLSD